MITRTILRLFGAVLLGLVGLGIVGGTGGAGVGGIGFVLVGVALIWGTIEMFILGTLLLLYGVSGVIHDIGAIQGRDPWNRW